MYFSKTTLGFYPEEMRAKYDKKGTWPADAVLTSKEKRDEILAGEAAGKIIAADAEGLPILVNPSPPSVSEIWASIKAKRDAIKIGGVKVGSKWFHSDDASKIQQIGLVMMGAGIPAGLLWKTMDGSFVTMTQALAGQVFGAVVAHEQAVFAAAETHNAAMRAAADPAAYDFSSGWPAVYAEATS